MTSGWRARTHLLVAGAMFVVCVGFGAFTDEAIHRTAAWFARNGEPAGRLQLAVQSGPHAIHLRNLTDQSWNSCIVIVEGGYASPPTVIGGRGLATLPYSMFAAGAEPLGDEEGFGRAFRSTRVACADGEQRREVAVLR